MTNVQTMKAAVTTAFGGADKLEFREDVPVPRPHDGEVLIEVGACCCNNSDIWLREGAYGREDDPNAKANWLRGAKPPEFPLIQGADIVGRIVEVGRNVDDGWLSKRVLVDHTLHDDASNEPYGIAGIIGSERDGGFAEYATAPVENLGVIEDEALSDIEIAALSSASFVTAMRMLERTELAEGETVLITGASGGVGTAAVQLAKLRGATVVALAGATKTEEVKACGADIVVPSRTPDLASAVRDAAAQEFVDVVADVVGGAIFTDLLTLLRPLGRYVTVGAVADALVELDLRTLYLKHLSLLGSTLGTKDDFRRLIRLINEGAVRPVVGGVFSLEHIHTAQDTFRGKDYVGNLVITPKLNELATSRGIQ